MSKPIVRNEAQNKALETLIQFYYIPLDICNLMVDFMGEFVLMDIKSVMKRISKYLKSMQKTNDHLERCNIDCEMFYFIVDQHACFRVKTKDFGSRFSFSEALLNRLDEDTPFIQKYNMGQWIPRIRERIEQDIYYLKMINT